jgi:gamma-glutamylputrescine oxidase
MTNAGYPDSYYVATAVGMVDYPELTDDVQADVCVIGGGFTGLSAALNLAERG